ncbi:MAG: GHKL domain-containing protein [Bdellovibrionales bacterium]|nr:GHKL domain-containing protein [Bdellovibrionales bacterium]
MNTQQEVNQQLHLLHHQRNKNVWIFHAVLVSMSTYIQREKLLDGNLWWIAFGVMIAGIGLRFLFLRVFYEKWKAGKVGAIVLNYAGQMTLAAAWATHFAAILEGYGPNSINASNTFIIFAGIISGASISSMAHPKSYHAICGSMCLSLLSFYVIDPDAHKAIIIYVLLFYVFTTININMSHKQLCRSIENEVRARSEEERISRIIDTVPGYVSVFDKDLNCTLANKATLKLYPDLVGNKIGNFDKEAGWEAFLLNFIENKRQHSVVEAHSKVAGKEVCFLRNAQKTFDEGVVFVSLDITELILSRKKLREQEGKAHFAAKLASLGEMAAGIAHEINNPLTIIQGSASVIQKLIDQDPMDKETIKTLGQKLIQTSERISKTIKSLKNLSRDGEGDPFLEIDFAKMLDQCLEICRQRCIRDGIELKLPKFTNPALFKGREVQLSQVLMNLLSNAMDAVKNDKQPWIEVCYQQGPDALDIFISDSGPGVPEGIREKIMEPFFTTKDVNQGTGLGLSISKSIMHSHKGELTLMEGTHTTFRMHLPTLS